MILVIVKPDGTETSHHADRQIAMAHVLTNVCWRDVVGILMLDDDLIDFPRAVTIERIEQIANPPRWIPR